LKKIILQATVVFLLFIIVTAGAALTEDSSPAENKTLQSALSAIKLGGGISAGYFYASNPGEEASKDEFLLSNFLIEVSSADETLPIGFVGAFGQTSTPSLLCTPEKNEDFDIEYASLTLKPISNVNLEIGLLQPNSGFENTYTFNNKNIILGAIASQQPYNAYGARICYDMNGISFWGGYYKGRLDDEEYNSPDSTWEIGISGTVADNDVSIYNYHITGQRNLFGVVIERTIKNIDLAFNIDYWTWDDDVKDLYESESAIGAAFYVCPKFGNFSIPVRLEYINQNKSQIYIESPAAKQIYAATISPTWHFNKNSYIRAESAYIKANGGFADEDGKTRDNRVNFAVELGFIF
jgi:hypothetical protein